MPRPNFDLMQRQQREIASFVGETATMRRYHTAQAGAPQFGVDNKAVYIEKTITGLFNPMTLQEIQAAGGMFVAGDIHATILDYVPSSADEIIWRGVIYRVESDHLPQPIVGASAHRVLLRRGG